jgi:four helix bundle protein
VEISAKEAHDTYYWLRLFAACDVVDRARLEDLLDEVNQIIAILTAIGRNVKRSLAK